MAQSTGSVRPVVLVVDDDADVCDTTAHMLNARGFNTLTAVDKAGALDILDQDSGLVGVVVADLAMPGDTPGDLTRAIMAAHPHVKIIYATGVPRHVAVATGLVQPDAPYLEKPVDMDVLAGLVRSFVARRNNPPTHATAGP
jgi:DNA-binding NtrC family response regulator